MDSGLGIRIYLIRHPVLRKRVPIWVVGRIELSRWRIAKSKASHKIDVVVALSMAALACVKERRPPFIFI